MRKYRPDTACPWCNIVRMFGFTHDGVPGTSTGYGDECVLLPIFCIQKPSITGSPQRTDLPQGQMTSAIVKRCGRVQGNSLLCFQTMEPRHTGSTRRIPAGSCGAMGATWRSDDVLDVRPEHAQPIRQSMAGDAAGATNW